MSTFDIVLLVILGFGALKGYQRGFVVEVFSFFAFFLGLYLALTLTIPVAVSLFGSTNYFDFMVILVFIVLFILISVGIKAGARLLKGAIDFTLFGTVDNLLGAIAGLLKWGFILSVIFWVFNSVGLDIVERYVNHTTIFPYIVGIGPKVYEWMSYLLPFLNGLIDDLNNLPNQQDTFVTFFVSFSV